MGRHAGHPVVLTADRVLMADHRVLFDGMLAAGQTTLVPGPVMRRLVAPRMPADGVRARRAPLGLRRIEAALIAGGFTDDDVVIVPPERLAAAVGPATRVVAVSSGDPLGLGMSDSTMEGISGGEVYTRRWFRRLMARIARLKRKHDFTVVFGGPGAWQLVQHPDARRALGIDTVFTGYGEGGAVDLFRRLRDGGGAPDLVAARRTAAADIPAIRGPSSMGAVEISRGCGLGCDFCTMADQPMIHLPPEAVLADVETNVRGGADSVALLSEDLFRYGSSGVDVNPGAVIDLVRAVRRAPGLRLIQTDHAGVASVARFEPDALRDLHDAFTDGVRHDFLWINIGVETAAGSLLGAAKRRPFSADEWPDVCRTAVHRLIEAGFLPMVSLVMGLPGEQPDHVERTLAFVESLSEQRLLIFPIFYAPVTPEQRAFTVRDMTPLHWRLFRRCYRLNFRWVPPMFWDNLRGAAAPVARALALQIGGRLQVLHWKVQFVLKSRRKGV